MGKARLRTEGLLDSTVLRLEKKKNQKGSSWRDGNAGDRGKVIWGEREMGPLEEKKPKTLHAFKERGALVH